MKWKFRALILGILMASGVAGCAPHAAVQRESLLEKNWGRSFESARYHQTLNPAAGENLDPVAGFDGPTAERVMNGYVNGSSQKQEPPTEFGVVTIKK